jgi:hypothetical protein
VYLEKYPKWFPYGIDLSMALMGRCFEEVYKKPWKDDQVVKWLRILGDVAMKPRVV